MSSFNILKKSDIHKSFRVSQIMGMFDVPEKKESLESWTVNFPLEERSWNIGLIVGTSGSGKTSIASEVFKNDYIHKEYKWSDEKSILDDFDIDIDTKKIVESLCSVGLSSPPDWLKPFRCLSNGQKFRVELSRLILEKRKRVVFDEFTSVVDRNVAKISCAAISKTIRMRQRPQFVAISCHHDIIDWLQADWIFDVNENRFEWRMLRRHPEIKIDVFEATTKEWEKFRKHHYLSTNIHRAAKCFVAKLDSKIIGFTSYLHHPHANVKNFKREHRTVVLPDYQGVGIGNRLSEFIAKKTCEQGYRFISATSHPSMIRHRSKSKEWKCLRSIGHASKSGKGSTSYGTFSINRITATFEYVLNK